MMGRRRAGRLAVGVVEDQAGDGGDEGDKVEQRRPLLQHLRYSPYITRGSPYIDGYGPYIDVYSPGIVRRRLQRRRSKRGSAKIAASEKRGCDKRGCDKGG